MFFRIGQLYFENEKYINARNVFENMLRINPSDEQGVKWYLMKCYLELEDYIRLLNFTKLFPLDYNVGIAMNRLLALLKLGEVKKAEKLFNELVKIYAIAMEYLANGKPEDFVFEPKAYISVGKTGAYMYFKHFSNYWDLEDLEFLKERMKTIKEKAENIKKELQDEIIQIQRNTDMLE